MTVASEQNRSGPYTGNGVTTIFNYGFRILDEDHIRVILATAGVETVLTIDTDYIVSDVGEAGGGQVALTVAPTAAQTIIIRRNVPFTQETDLENQGPYFAETIEAALDLAAMRDQQLSERLDRAAVLPGSADADDLVAAILAAGENALIAVEARDTAGESALIAVGARDAAVAAAAEAAAGVAFSQGTPNSISRPTIIKARETFSIADTGAIGDNSTDDTTAILRALSDCAGSTYKRRLIIPSGISRVQTGQISIPAGIELVGENRDQSVLRALNATGDLVLLNGSRARIINMKLDSAVARTAGSFIRVTTNASRVQMCALDLDGPFVGVTVDNPVALVAMLDIDVNATVAASGRSFDINGGFAVMMDHIVCRADPAFKPFAHVNVTQVEDLCIMNSQLISGLSNLNVQPGNGQNIGLIYSVGTQYDNATNASIRVAPAAGGNVRELYIQSPWIYGQAQCVLITNAGGGTVDSAHIANSLLIGTANGVEAVGVNNISVTGCRIGGFAKGITYTNVYGGSISGNIIGPHGLYGANTKGLVLTGTTSQVTVTGNKMSDNTAAVDLTGLTPATNVISGNTGYPTIAATGITVGASPFTYTAGPSPETVCVNGGTVSLISISGVGVLQSSGHCVALGPNQSITVTWSVVPTMVKSINR